MPEQRTTLIHSSVTQVPSSAKCTCRKMTLVVVVVAVAVVVVVVVVDVMSRMITTEMTSKTSIPVKINVNHPFVEVFRYDPQTNM